MNTPSGTKDDVEQWLSHLKIFFPQQGEFENNHKNNGVAYD